MQGTYLVHNMSQAGTILKDSAEFHHRFAALVRGSLSKPCHHMSSFIFKLTLYFSEKERIIRSRKRLSCWADYSQTRIWSLLSYKDETFGTDETFGYFAWTNTITISSIHYTGQFWPPVTSWLGIWSTTSHRLKNKVTNISIWYILLLCTKMVWSQDKVWSTV